MYPGQTSVAIVSVGASSDVKGPVSIAVDNLPTGLTATSVGTTAGSPAAIIFRSSLNLATECFKGDWIYTANIPLGIRAKGPGGEAVTLLPLTVVLENPSFSPTMSDLPTLQITTDGGLDVTSKDDYLTGSFILTDSKAPLNNYSETMQVKGRGNSTWAMPKKPYTLKLDSKAGLLGMAPAKKWVLLANYADKTMLRNALASHISEMFGMRWTPDSRFVELYLNGAYRGTYQISEKVEIGKSRLDITQIDDTDNSGKSLTGGYLMEIDNYRGDEFNFDTLHYGLPIGSGDPDPPTPAQQSYITSTVNAAEKALSGPNFTDSDSGWPAYFDQDSLVQWFIVEELMGNKDGNFWSSDYFYKQRNDPRLYMGPIWDFDGSAGNTEVAVAADPQQPWIRTQAAWYVRLFQDPAFLAAVQSKWTAMRSQVGELPSYIDSSATSLELAQSNNYKRWPNLGQRVPPNPQATGSYQGEVATLKDWMTKRIAYMDANYLKK